MAEYHTFCAFKTRDINRVTDEIQAYLSNHKVGSELIEANEESFDEDYDALIFPPKNEWVIIHWPQFFSCVAVTRHITETCQVFGSSMEVFDGDWHHAFFDGRELVHNFSSVPEDMGINFENKPDVGSLSDLLGLDKSRLEPYFVDQEIRSEGGKAFGDDTFELDDFWVFTDFWQKMGIHFPASDSDATAILRLKDKFDHL